MKILLNWKSLLIVALMIQVSGCAPFRAVQSSGWMERYGIVSEEELNHQPDVVPKLVRATSDRNANVRVAAITHLAKLGSEAEPAIDNLKMIAVSDRSLAVRRHSLSGLIRIVGSDHEHSMYVLKHTLTDQNRNNAGQRAATVRMLRHEPLGPDAINFLEEVATIERHPNIKADMMQIALARRMSNPNM